MLQAALLHDTIEDTELTEEMINDIFGAEVAVNTGRKMIQIFNKHRLKNDTVS